MTKIHSSIARIRIFQGALIVRLTFERLFAIWLAPARGRGSRFFEKWVIVEDHDRTVRRIYVLAFPFRTLVFHNLWSEYGWLPIEGGTEDFFYEFLMSNREAEPGIEEEWARLAAEDKRR